MPAFDVTTDRKLETLHNVQKLAKSGVLYFHILDITGAKFVLVSKFTMGSPSHYKFSLKLMRYRSFNCGAYFSSKNDTKSYLTGRIFFLIQ